MLDEDEYTAFSEMTFWEKRDILRRELDKYDKEFAELKSQCPGFSSKQWCEWIKRNTGFIQIC